MTSQRIRIRLKGYDHRILDQSVREIVDAVRRGGDTDTNGAITGALLGALYGLSKIPYQWKESVLTCESRSGLSFPGKPRPRDFWPTDVLELAAALFNLQLT